MVADKCELILGVKNGSHKTAKMMVIIGAIGN